MPLHNAQPVAAGYTLGGVGSQADLQPDPENTCSEGTGSMHGCTHMTRDAFQCGLPVHVRNSCHFTMHSLWQPVIPCGGGSQADLQPDPENTCPGVTRLMHGVKNEVRDYMWD